MSEGSAVAIRTVRSIVEEAAREKGVSCECITWTPADTMKKMDRHLWERRLFTEAVVESAAVLPEKGIPNFTILLPNDVRVTLFLTLQSDGKKTTGLEVVYMQVTTPRTGVREKAEARKKGRAAKQEEVPGEDLDDDLLDIP